MSIQVSLEAIDPATGERLGPLPMATDIKLSVPWNDMPSLRFSYSPDAVGWSLVERNPFIEVRLNGDVSNRLPWFIVPDWDARGEDDARIKNFSCTGVPWLLHKALVYPPPASLKEGRIASSNAALVSAKNNVNRVLGLLRNFYGAKSNVTMNVNSYAPTGSTAYGWINNTNPSKPVVSRWVKPAKATDQGSWVPIPGATGLGAEYLIAVNDRDVKQQTLTKVRNDTSTERQFRSATPGTILRTLIDEAKGRAGHAINRLSFGLLSADTDSFGKPWPSSSRMDIDVKAGSSILQVLENLTEQGMCDWISSGRDVSVAVPDSLSIHREQQFHAGSDYVGEPSRGSYANYANRVLMLGDNGFWTEDSRSAEPSPWGTLEESVTQSGVADQATARSLIARHLDTSTHERVEHTKNMLLNDDSKLPLVVVKPGDWIKVDNGNALEEMRTAEVILTVPNDTGNTQATMTLNSRFLEMAIRNAKNIKAYSGSTSASNGGTGGLSTDPLVIDDRIPTVPEISSVTPAAYILPAGSTAASMEWTWLHDGLAIDGVTINVDYFEIGYRTDQRTAWSSLKRFPGEARAGGHEPLEVYRNKENTPLTYSFRLRAVATNGYASEWSEEVTVLAPTDVTPPPVPHLSQSNVTTFLRVPSVTWDGMGIHPENGSIVKMPLDFAYATVWRSSTDPSLGNVEPVAVAKLGNATAYTGEQIPSGEKCWFAMSATDKTGNESGRTEWFSAEGKANVDLSTITDKIDAAKMSLVNVNGSSIAPNTITYNQVFASEEMWTKVLGSHKILAGEVNANQIWSDQAWLGSMFASKAKLGSSPDAAGNYTELDGTGIRQYGPDGRLLTQLGTTGSQRLTVMGDRREFAASIDDGGGVTGTQVYAEGDLWYGGRTVESRVNEAGRGVVAWAKTYTAQKVEGTPSQRAAYLRVSAYLEEGRTYRVSTTALEAYVSDIPTKDKIVVDAWLHIRQDGGDAHTGSPMFNRSYGSPVVPGSVARVIPPLTHMVHGNNQWNSFLLSVATQDSSGNGGGARLIAGADSPTELVVEDMGTFVTEGPDARVDGTGTSSTSIRHRVARFFPNPTYAGVFKNGELDSTYPTWNTTVCQFGTKNGDRWRTIFRMGPDVNTGSYQSAIFNGATVTGFSVYIKTLDWFSSGGGTMKLGLLSDANSLNANSTGKYTANPEVVISAPGFKRGQGMWVDIPSAYWNDFKTGKYIGFTLEGDTNIGSWGTAVARTIEVRVNYYK